MTNPTKKEDLKRKDSNLKDQEIGKQNDLDQNMGKQSGNLEDPDEKEHIHGEGCGCGR